MLSILDTNVVHHTPFRPNSSKPIANKIMHWIEYEFLSDELTVLCGQRLD